MKILAKSFGFALIFFFFSGISFSQTFEEFKSQIRDDYNNFEKETQQKFDDFVVSIDKEFADYLKSSFGNYKIEDLTINANNNKPEVIPESTEIITDDYYIEPLKTTKFSSFQQTLYPGIYKEESNDFAKSDINVSFLGWPLVFKIDSDFKTLRANTPNPENISNYWNNAAKLNYNAFLFQISEVSKQLNLNKWAYYQLITQCSKSIYPTDKNSQILFQWTMLIRSRYRVKLAYNNENYTLLIPFNHEVYDLPYVNFENLKYYIPDNWKGDLTTYSKDFPESDILMDISIIKPFYTNPIKKSSVFRFLYNDKKYEVELEWDEEMDRFYNTIPLSGVETYFNSVGCTRTKNSIKKQFNPILNGKSKIEKINILLAFVQQAFDYKTDKQAFGHERYFFPDEILNYPYSDCEDRSIFFKWLVEVLLDENPIGLTFNGHMCTAIASDVPNLNYTKYENIKYVVADPTFRGATFGTLMPQFLEDKPVLIIGRNDIPNLLADKIHKRLTEESIYTTASNTITRVDEAFYSFGYQLDSDNNLRNSCLIKFNSNGKTIWKKTLKSDNDNTPLGLLVFNNDIYLYGSFINNLKLNDTEIETNGESDIYLAKFNQNGEALWLKKAGLDKINHQNNFAFAFRFNTTGEKTFAKLYSQNEDFSDFGIEIINDEILVKGSFYGTTGIKQNDYLAYDLELDAENIPVLLHNTDLSLKQKEYEDAIAGLFAVMNIVKGSFVEIAGSSLQNTFDKYNSNFSDYAASFYQNIGKMKFMQNNKGIIVIKTLDGNSIILDKIIIENNARIKIIKYKSGNISIDILSGIKVGSPDNWLTMNSIKLYKESGDLLLNYDTDNSVIKLNLKKEILKH